MTCPEPTHAPSFQPRGLAQSRKAAKGEVDNGLREALPRAIARAFRTERFDNILASLRLGALARAIPAFHQPT